MDPEWILNTSLSQGTSSSSSGSVLFICVFVQVFHCRVSERRCLTSHVIPCHPGPLASSRWGRWDIARVARGLVHPVAPHRLFSFNSFEHASSIQFNCLSLSLCLCFSVFRLLYGSPLGQVTHLLASRSRCHGAARPHVPTLTVAARSSGGT